MANWIISFFGIVAGLGFSSGSDSSVNSENNNKKLFPVELERVILVDVVIPAAVEAPKCYTSTYDKKRVEVQVEFDDPLNNLTDFVLEGDPVEGAECFLPELKIIYRDYTYVISLYCASTLKFKNLAPYTPSNVKVSNDLEVTEDMLSYLRTTHKHYFGVPYSPVQSAKIAPKKVFLDEKDPIVDDPSIGDDEDREDNELQKDAIDKEGWFKDVQDDDNGDLPVDPDDE